MSLPVARSEMQKMKDEVDKLSSSLAESKSTMESLESHAVEVSKEIDSLNAEKLELSENIPGLDASTQRALSMCRARDDDVKERLMEIQAEIEVLQEEFSKRKADDEKAKHLYLQDKERLELELSEMQQKADSLDKLSQDRVRRREEPKKLKQQLSKLRVEVVNAEQTRDQKIHEFEEAEFSSMACLESAREQLAQKTVYLYTMERARESMERILRLLDSHRTSAGSGHDQSGSFSAILNSYSTHSESLAQNKRALNALCEFLESIGINAERQQKAVVDDDLKMRFLTAAHKRAEYLEREIEADITEMTRIMGELKREESKGAARHDGAEAIRMFEERRREALSIVAEKEKHASASSSALSILESIIPVVRSWDASTMGLATTVGSSFSSSNFFTIGEAQRKQALSFQHLTERGKSIRMELLGAMKRLRAHVEKGSYPASTVQLLNSDWIHLACVVLGVNGPEEQQAMEYQQHVHRVKEQKRAEGVPNVDDLEFPKPPPLSSLPFNGFKSEEEFRRVLSFVADLQQNPLPLISLNGSLLPHSRLFNETKNSAARYEKECNRISEDVMARRTHMKGLHEQAEAWFAIARKQRDELEAKVEDMEKEVLGVKARDHGKGRRMKEQASGDASGDSGSASDDDKASGDELSDADLALRLKRFNSNIESLEYALSNLTSNEERRVDNYDELVRVLEDRIRLLAQERKVTLSTWASESFEDEDDKEIEAMVKRARQEGFGGSSSSDKRKKDQKQPKLVDLLSTSGSSSFLQVFLVAELTDDLDEVAKMATSVRNRDKQLERKEKRLNELKKEHDSLVHQDMDKIAAEIRETSDQLRRKNALLYQFELHIYSKSLSECHIRYDEALINEAKAQIAMMEQLLEYFRVEKHRIHTVSSTASPPDLMSREEEYIALSTELEDLIAQHDASERFSEAQKLACEAKIEKLKEEHTVLTDNVNLLSDISKELEDADLKVFGMSISSGNYISKVSPEVQEYVAKLSSLDLFRTESSIECLKCLVRVVDRSKFTVSSIERLINEEKEISKCVQAEKERRGCSLNDKYKTEFVRVSSHHKKQLQKLVNKLKSARDNLKEQLDTADEYTHQLELIKDRVQEDIRKSRSRPRPEPSLSAERMLTSSSSERFNAFSFSSSAFARSPSTSATKTSAYLHTLVQATYEREFEVERKREAREVIEMIKSREVEVEEMIREIEEGRGENIIESRVMMLVEQAERDVRGGEEEYEMEEIPDESHHQGATRDESTSRDETDYSREEILEEEEERELEKLQDEEEEREPLMHDDVPVPAALPSQEPQQSVATNEQSVTTNEYGWKSTSHTTTSQPRTSVSRQSMPPARVPSHSVTPLDSKLGKIIAAVSPLRHGNVFFIPHHSQRETVELMTEHGLVRVKGAIERTVKLSTDGKRIEIFFSKTKKTSRKTFHMIKQIKSISKSCSNPLKIPGETKRMPSVRIDFEKQAPLYLVSPMRQVVEEWYEGLEKLLVLRKKNPGKYSSIMQQVM
eukprot:gnl/Carplike_NY0171/2711_a3640_335.p1 GENE.gnl/Carplike_NY0171/2711_a3640_335~~gnl/Carplike_NY0171/2711_a3640_335.p1  ORF type:complete len:1740 (-),score=561.40 gnl/Carplike_NY0171/2711_a3640_335:40-4545(-)